jgi:hypothetical protein
MQRPAVLLIAAVVSSSAFAQTAETVQCDVVIAGGSTAALSAALTSAKDGAFTCLLEPFNQAGGQLLNTPAIDHAWHTADKPTAAHALVKSGDVDKIFENQPPILRDWLRQLGGAGGTNGNCWVAGFDDCFLPLNSSFNASTDKNLLRDFITPGLANTPNLRVIYNTVVRKSNTAITSAAGQPVVRKITSVIATQRTATPATTMDGFDATLSSDVSDWYSPVNSRRWTKSVLTITARTRGLVVIDASEFGDVLATSGSTYLVGTETGNNEASMSTNEACGQAIVFPFFMKYKGTSGAATENAPNWTVPFPNHYAFDTNSAGRSFTWSQIWAYRRVHNPAGSLIVGGGNFTTEYKVADLANNISLQNWTTGNDYPYRTLFKSKAASQAEATQGWTGGLDLTALAESEKHAIGWYYWMKARTPASSAARITIGTEITGTFSGLTRFPYLRSTRRSVGLGNFKLTSLDFKPETIASKTGKVFADKVALANYPLDIHPIKSTACTGAAGTPAVVHPYPYYIPFRALTNVSTENLLVAGKTIAQSFWASTSTRLQPEEFAIGQAAGAAAGWMSRNNVGSTQAALNRITEVQANTIKYTPNVWRF